MTEQELSHVLEELVDRVGMDRVLDTLAQVCFEKAEHIRVSYGDDEVADEWEDTGADIARVESYV